MSRKINTTALRESIEHIKNSDELVRDCFRQLDFEEVVGSVLREWGYVYTIDATSGDFTIIAAPGGNIRCIWHGTVYSISIDLSYAGIKAKSSKQDFVFLKDAPILITPFGLKSYKFYFDKLVEDIKAVYMRFEETVKGEKGAKLLKTLINPVLRVNKLSKTTLEKCTDDSDQFWLSKQFSTDGIIRIRINFNDYELKCIRLAEAYGCFPDWLCHAEGLHYTLGSPYYKYYPLPKIRKGQGAIKIVEGNKMLYSKPISITGKNSNGYLSSELSENLTNMGYIYYIEDHVYNIYINEDIVLCRNGVSFWFRQLSTGRLSNNFIMRDIEFAKMLDIIVLGAIENQGYYYNTLPDSGSFKFLERAIQKSLPKHIYYHFGSSSILIHDEKEFFTVDTKSPICMTILWEIIETVNSRKRVFNYSDFPDVEICIKRD